MLPRRPKIQNNQSRGFTRSIDENDGRKKEKAYLLSFFRRAAPAYLYLAPQISEGGPATLSTKRALAQIGQPFCLCRCWRMSLHFTMGWMLCTRSRGKASHGTVLYTPESGRKERSTVCHVNFGSCFPGHSLPYTRDQSERSTHVTPEESGAREKHQAPFRRPPPVKPPTPPARTRVDAESKQSHMGGIDCRRPKSPFAVAAAARAPVQLSLRSGREKTSSFRTFGCRNLSWSVESTRSSRSW